MPLLLAIAAVFSALFQALGRRRVREPSAKKADPTRSRRDYGLCERVPAHKRYDKDSSGWFDSLKRLLRGAPREPIPAYRGLLEDPPKDGEEKRIGICCSGGGIRSAAFNLGALQELQAADVLSRATYLAAVSGGSYIAASFSMVAKSAPKALQTDDSDAALVNDDAPPFYRNSPEEQYLRNRTSYLAPGGSGKQRLVLHIALGLFVNLAFIGIGLILCAWLFALYYRVTQKALEVAWSDYALAITPWQESVAIGAVAAIALTLGLFSLLLGPSKDRSRRLFENSAIWGFALVGFLVIAEVGLPHLLAALRNSGLLGNTHEDITSSGTGGAVGAGVGGGFASLLAAILLQLRAKLSVKKVEGAVTRFSKLNASVKRLLEQAVAWLVGPLLLGGVFVFALLVFVNTRHIAPWIIAIIAVGWSLFWIAGDVTAWSLHPFYRRQLCTAFALKRIDSSDGDPAGVALERDYALPTRLSDYRFDPDTWGVTKWPTLLVCAAANVSDTGATPPGRQVTSFTFSSEAMGGPLVGGVRTHAFEERIHPSRHSDFSLAAAVAMSGAAISPSMGKETRGAYRFLLGLANVRLGVWVPNPRRVDKWVENNISLRKRLADSGRDIKTVDEPLAPDAPTAVAYPKRFMIPRPGPWYLIREMFGWNSVNDPYLYVTDGGHYENLGLVELLRRGCTEIFCFDASGGKELTALGDAIALARSELDVEIDIDPSGLAENKKRLADKCCAAGTISYSDGTRGVLIYVRTVVTKEAPYDVQAFRVKDPAFPHHSTADQLYTDQKFEAYRELGAHAAQRALEEGFEAERALQAEVAHGRRPRESVAVD